MSQPTQLLTFRTQGRWYACDLLWVREILRQPSITPVDQAPPIVRGLIHLRGQILTALDLDLRLGCAGGAEKPSACCIVFKTSVELGRLAQQPESAEQAGQDLLGILVDEIGDILSQQERVLPPPPESLSGLDPACIAGVIPRPAGLVSLLHVHALLRPSTATAA